MSLMLNDDLIGRMCSWFICHGTQHFRLSSPQLETQADLEPSQNMHSCTLTVTSKFLSKRVLEVNLNKKVHLLVFLSKPCLSIIEAISCLMWPNVLLIKMHSILLISELFRGTNKRKSSLYTQSFLDIDCPKVDIEVAKVNQITAHRVRITRIMNISSFSQQLADLQFF